MARPGARARQFCPHEDIEAELLRRAKAGDPDAIDQLWRWNERFLQLSMLDHAHATGGTSTRWCEGGIIVEYASIGEEGLVEDAEPSTSSKQEGALEADLRSAAADVFVRATRGFDPERGTPYRVWLWICARNAVRDLKEERPAGLAGKSKQAEPVARTGPSKAELEAKAIADRILEIRSEAYVLRWCARSDVDAIDRDIVNLNLVRPPSSERQPAAIPQPGGNSCEAQRFTASHRQAPQPYC